MDSQRPSAASKRELEKYRAKFDQDRARQILSPEEHKQALKWLETPEHMEEAEEKRVWIGRGCLQGMGLVHHSLSGYDRKQYKKNDYKSRAALCRGLAQLVII